MQDIYNRKSIRVPVKIIDGKVEYFYGGLLPVKIGTIGDLVLDEMYISDKNFLNLLKRKSQHKILGEGTELLVSLTIKNETKIDENLIKHLISSDDSRLILGTPHYYKYWTPTTRFVKMKIDKPTDRQFSADPKAVGGIWLDLQGFQTKGITTSSIMLHEDITNDAAISLNHAFTILSEKYEPWRKSHTGNAYDRVLYKENNNKWYPIDVLRNTAIIKDEHQLIKEQWEIISKKLGLQKI